MTFMWLAFVYSLRRSRVNYFSMLATAFRKINFFLSLPCPFLIFFSLLLARTFHIIPDYVSANCPPSCYFYISCTTLSFFVSTDHTINYLPSISTERKNNSYQGLTYWRYHSYPLTDMTWHLFTSLKHVNIPQYRRFLLYQEKNIFFGWSWLI